MSSRPGAVVALASLALSLAFAGGRPVEAGDGVAPTIRFSSASSASLAGGEEITVTGMGFDSETTVVLGDAAAADVVVEGAEHLHFLVPPQKASGVRVLTVRNTAGLDQTSFHIVPPPLSALGPCEITTVVGGIGAVGDGYPAASDPTVLAPARLAVDAAGNLYVSDAGAHRVRRVDAATGAITTIAGDGRAEYAGDGGPASAARLAEVSAIAVAGAGNLYVATYGGVVRAIRAGC